MNDIIVRALELSLDGVLYSEMDHDDRQQSVDYYHRAINQAKEQAKRIEELEDKIDKYEEMSFTCPAQQDGSQTTPEDKES